MSFCHCTYEQTQISTCKAASKQTPCAKWIASDQVLVTQNLRAQRVPGTSRKASQTRNHKQTEPNIRCKLLPPDPEKGRSTSSTNSFNSPRPRPKRSEVPIRIPLFPTLIPSQPSCFKVGGGVKEPQGPAVKSRLLQWIWAVCRESHPRSPPLPLFRHFFSCLHCLHWLMQQPSMRCKPKILDTKHGPICFHFLPFFKLEFLSLLSPLIVF